MLGVTFNNIENQVQELFVEIRRRQEKKKGEESLTRGKRK